jgi:hypothetical protein
MHLFTMRSQCVLNRSSNQDAHYSCPRYIAKITCRCFHTSHMVLSIIFLEDKHTILLHLSIFYEYQQFFQHRICFSIQPPDYSDPWSILARSTSFFLIMLFKNIQIHTWISDISIRHLYFNIHRTYYLFFKLHEIINKHVLAYVCYYSFCNEILMIHVFFQRYKNN